MRRIFFLEFGLEVQGEGIDTAPGRTKKKVGRLNSWIHVTLFGLRTRISGHIA